jgi:Ca2+-binding RTX toxin-like protein
MSGLTNTVHSFDLVAKDALGNAGVEHVVYGTTGNDVMSGTSANEVFTGRGGNDTFVFSGNFGKDTIADFQASTDTIQLDHSAFADFASVLSHATQVGSDVVIAHDAQDSITLHNTVVSQLTSQNFHLV